MAEIIVINLCHVWTKSNHQSNQQLNVLVYCSVMSCNRTQTLNKILLHMESHSVFQET